MHGDYRTGNYLYLPEGEFLAILDWEMAHIGDPLEDLAWSLDLRQNIDKPELAGGLVSHRDAIRFWQEASGLDVDPIAFRWWQVFSALKALVDAIGPEVSARRGGAACACQDRLAPGRPPAEDSPGLHLAAFEAARLRVRAMIVMGSDGICHIARHVRQTLLSSTLDPYLASDLRFTAMCLDLIAEDHDRAVDVLKADREHVAGIFAAVLPHLKGGLRDRVGRRLGSATKDLRVRTLTQGVDDDMRVLIANCTRRSSSPSRPAKHGLRS